MGVPAWKNGSNYETLNIVDRATALGYTIKQFLPVKQTDLLYHRPDQLVGREILVLTRDQGLGYSKALNPYP